MSIEFGSREPGAVAAAANFIDHRPYNIRYAVGALNRERPLRRVGYNYPQPR